MCVCVTHQSKGVTEQSQSVLSREISEDVENGREKFRRVGHSIESLTTWVQLRGWKRSVQMRHVCVCECEQGGQGGSSRIK